MCYFGDWENIFQKTRRVRERLKNTLLEKVNVKSYILDNLIFFLMQIWFFDYYLFIYHSIDVKDSYILGM